MKKIVEVEKETKYIRHVMPGDSITLRFNEHGKIYFTKLELVEIEKNDKRRKKDISLGEMHQDNNSNKQNN